MSSPPVLSQVLLILFFFTNVIMCMPSNKSAALLDRVCKKTHDYSLCISSLKSDPRSLHADSKELAVIIMDLALIKAIKIDELIVHLNKTTSDPIMKSRFDACTSDYILSKGYLQQAINAFESIAYKESYGMLILAASSGPGQCEDDFAKAPARKSPLKAVNANLASMLTIAEDILSIFLN